MYFDCFIEWIGDNAEVVAILLVAFFALMVLRMVANIIMWLCDCFTSRRRYRRLFPAEPQKEVSDDRPERSEESCRVERSDLPAGAPLEWFAQDLEPPVEVQVRFLAADLEDYRRLFLGRESLAEGRKSVYISPELHRRIRLYTHALAGTERVTMSGFIERVVGEHLNDYKQVAGQWTQPQE